MHRSLFARHSHNIGEMKRAAIKKRVREKREKNQIEIILPITLYYMGLHVAHTQTHISLKANCQINAKHLAQCGKCV